MKLVGKRGLSGLVEIALYALMVVAFGLTITLPWSVAAVTHHQPGGAGWWYEKYLAVLLVSGVLSECILWQARGLMHNVNTGKAFSRNTVRRLRTIGWICLALALFYFVAVFIVTRFFMVVVFVAFSVVGTILFVFAELFLQAVRYKEENDMTI